MNRIFLSFVLLLAGVAASGQNRVVPGYVVTENGDTLKGQIELKGHYTAPDFINFTSNGGAVQQYSVENCKAFGTNEDVYERWEVKMDMSCMNRIDFKVFYEDSTLVDTVFLKQVFKGNNLTLYKYYRGNETGLLKSDREKMHFFLYDDEKLQELIISYKEPHRDMDQDPNVFRYRADWSARQTRMFFRDQLRAYFDWSAERRLRRQIDELQYEEAPLVKAVRSIDNKIR